MKKEFLSFLFIQHNFKPITNFTKRYKLLGIIISMYLYYYWKILSNYEHFSRQNNVIPNKPTNNISFFKSSIIFQRRMIITLHQTVGSQSRNSFRLLHGRQGLSLNITILIEIIAFQDLLKSYNQSQKSWDLGSPRKCLHTRDQGRLSEIV